jgi:hypothetical protein
MFASRFMCAASNEQAIDPHLPSRLGSVAWVLGVPASVLKFVREFVREFVLKFVREFVRVRPRGCRMQMLIADEGPNRSAGREKIKPFQDNELQEEEWTVLVLAFPVKEQRLWSGRG